jgi:hypothetical protein
MVLDRHTLAGAGVQVDTAINFQQDQITTGAMLVLLFEPYDLAATYRFGVIWITTKDDAKSWVDRTGIAELLKSPPPEVRTSDREKIRAAFEQPAQFDFLDTPVHYAAKWLSETYRVPIVCDEGIKDMPLTSNLRGVTFQNALGALCEHYGLRVRWKDGNTLVIEPQEEAE